MNIGIVTTWFPAGAGYVSKAYRDILSKEHNVFIYARGGRIMKGDSFWDDEKVTWASRNFNGIKISPFLKWAKKNKIDVLFFNEQRFWKPILKAKEKGIIVGAYIDYYVQATVHLFEIYDFLICNTKRHYSVFKDHKNCYYIPWGTDIEKFKPRKKEGINQLTFLISAGWEGSHTRDRRGALLSLKAFLNSKGNCRLKFYNQIPWEKCSPAYKELISQDSRIEFIYGTFEPFPYEDGDIFLYPSRLDGIGLTLPEAITSGLPAITTNSAPMNEFVIDGYNGTLINVEKYLGREDGYYWAESVCSVSSITEAIQSYIDNPEKILEQKLNARSFALKKLNWRANAADLSKIFKDSLEIKSTVGRSLSIAVKKIDRRMAPSLIFRLLLVFHDFYIFYIKKPK